MTLRRMTGGHALAAALTLVTVLGAACVAADRPAPTTDNVIVHLWEWRWDDIAIECETFLGPNGYAAVQVSPPQEDVLGNEWWTRYQPVTYKLQSRSGSEKQFRDMVRRCRAAKVDIIVDAVINHMANPPAPGLGRAGSPIGGRCQYATYGCSDFHNYCASYPSCSCCQNCAVQSCWNGGFDNLVNCNLGGTDGLPDLDTGSSYVRGQLAGYLSTLGSIGVAGLRVDAAKHMRPSDIDAVLIQSNTSLYANLEVLVGGVGDNCVPVNDYAKIGSVWEQKFADAVHQTLAQSNFNILLNIDTNSDWPGGARGLWAPGNRAISFVTNHDQFRSPYSTWLSWSTTVYRFANQILLAHPYGQPTLFSSVNVVNLNSDKAPVDLSKCSTPKNCTLKRVHQPYYLNCGAYRSGASYVCEHRWPEITGMVAWRRVAGLSGFTDGGFQPLRQNGQGLAWTRGGGNQGVAFIYASVAGYSVRDTVNTFGMRPGRYCNVAVAGCWPCTAGCSWVQDVDQNGYMTVKVNQYQVVAFHANSMLPAGTSMVVRDGL